MQKYSVSRACLKRRNRFALAFSRSFPWNVLLMRMRVMYCASGGETRCRESELYPVMAEPASKPGKVETACINLLDKLFHIVVRLTHPAGWAGACTKFAPKWRHHGKVKLPIMHSFPTFTENHWLSGEVTLWMLLVKCGSLYRFDKGVCPHDPVV